MNIIVTGATGNLGKAVNASLLKANHMVHAIVSPRDHPEKHDFNGTHIYKADLMNEPEVVHTVKKIYETTQQVEVAIMIVGGFVPGNIKETTLKDFEKMFRLNFVTAYNVARQCFIKMETQKDGGLLIFIGARPALHPGQAKGMVAYALTKSLLFRLSEVINEEGQGKNVCSSVVVPGIIDTRQNRESMPDADFSKWVKPEEIAEKILQLISFTGYQKKETVLKIYGKS